MARVQNTLIGRSSGSVGGATFSTWKGINVLKSKPETVANPDSDGQKMNRSAMRQLVAIFRQIPAAINAGFKKEAVHMSPYNAFVSAGRKNSFDYASPPAATFIPEDLLISKGTISIVASGSATFTDGDETVSFTWEDAVTAPGQSLTDTVILVAANLATGEWAAVTTGKTRADGSGTVELPSAWHTGDPETAYIGFYNETSQESSDSKFFGTT